jgi:hypothetical protein
MQRRDKIVLAIAIAVALTATIYGLNRMRSIRSLSGAVLRDDHSPRNEFPIPNAQVTVGNDPAEGSARSNSTGYFQVKLRRGIRRGETLTLHLRHPDYRPLDMTAIAADRLYVIRLTPAYSVPAPEGTPIAVSDIRLRYAMKSRTTENVGSVVKVFEVPNTGDIPCDPHGSGPCSPDGKWKAAIAGASLDAGEDNEFRDARVSCIAGPCPFTRIEKDSFSRGGQQIGVSVRNWSDTVSFVLEAEVMHTMSSDAILHSYPVIFNRTASFTLPPKAQGPSIEATVDRQEIVYPLGPKAMLSWANFEVQTEKDLTKLYRCVLKSGYQFQ